MFIRKTAPYFGGAEASRRDGERGSVLAYTVISVLVLFLAVGLGVDLSHLYLVKTEAQNAADAAATAGATALRDDEANRLELAMDRAVAVLNQNKYNFNNKEFDDIMSPADQRDLVKFAVNLGGPYRKADDVVDAGLIRFVEVTTPSVPVSMFFSVPILGTSRNIKATAVAGLASETTSPCMIALDPDDEKAFTVTSESNVTALNCEIAVRSNAYNGCNVESNSDVHAEAINICASNCNVTSGSDTTPDADSESEHCNVADPFAGLTPPPKEPCTFIDFPPINTTSLVELNPGVYCGGIKLNSQANVRFKAGMYVLNGGGLEIGSKSTVNGEGVTFYNTKTAASDVAGNKDFKPIIVNSDSSAPTTLISLSAPTAGPYKDMLFWQDASAGKIDDKNLFQLNNNVNLTGNLYFPTQPLAIESNTQSTISGRVVARTIAVQSHSRLTIDTGDPAGTSSIVRIVLYK
ncbi:MAG TPA: pilus assembly protein TadG-related protein [Pyrinomonadaceae bacterium]|nr:pilus assembly protein TadG-related protein [Pyrinomonadaceae bacterium]